MKSKWVEALEAALDAIEGKDDLAAVHDARKAARRLTIVLWLAGRRRLVRKARSLGRALGEVRDLQLLCEETSAGPFRAWLEGERDLRLARLQRIVAKRSTRAWLREARAERPLEAKRLRALERVASTQRKRATRKPTPRRLHAYRRSLRKVRDARACLERKPPSSQTVLSSLGLMADVALAVRWVDAFARAGGVVTTQDWAGLAAQLQRAAKLAHRVLQADG